MRTDFVRKYAVFSGRNPAREPTGTQWFCSFPVKLYSLTEDVRSEMENYRMKLKKKQIVLSAAGLGIAAFGAGCMYLANFAMYGRRQTLDEAYSWQAEKYDVSFYEPLEKTDYTIHSYDGYELHVQLCRCPVPGDKYVILSHGYTDNRFGCLKYMKLYLDAGFHCIIYDLRGHGLNERTFCTYASRESKDLHELIADTCRRYGSGITLGLHGESLGASTTIAVLAYDQDLAFAVSDCGFSEITNVMKAGLKMMHLPGWLHYPSSLAAKLRYGYAYTQMRPIDALSGNQVPVLFLHGEDDTFIVPKNSMDMQKADPGYSELYLIPEAKHANSVLKNPELYRQHLYGFLEHILKESADRNM